MKRVLIFLVIVLISACSTTKPPMDPVLHVTPETGLVTARALPATSRIVNISINDFEADRDVASSIYLANSQVRSVEQRYLPYMLKQTLDRSGFWGAVRVLPSIDHGAELQVEGKILSSSGIALKLNIKVTDATGRVWLDRIYQDVSDDIDFVSEPNHFADPFQTLYNRIANDLQDLLTQLESEHHQQIVNTALIRYGQLLAEEAFSGYLREEEERVYLVGLPARDDPVFAGLLRVREAEYLFADSVDAHYESLFQRIGPTYAWWRYYSYELIRGNERLGQIDATRGASRGSWYAVERIYKTFKEAKMNQDALRELTDSFDRETAATTAEIAGRVIELKGSLDTQYEMWRKILSNMYRDEVGI